jgi:hypothetical protein
MWGVGVEEEEKGSGGDGDMVESDREALWSGMFGVGAWGRSDGLVRASIKLSEMIRKR